MPSLLENGKKNWMEYFRILTPVFLFVLTLLIAGYNKNFENLEKNIGSLKEDIGKLDTKMFVHLTNSDIHIPREQIVSKGEFDIQCKLSEEKTKDIIVTQREILNTIKNIELNIRK